MMYHLFERVAVVVMAKRLDNILVTLGQRASHITKSIRRPPKEYQLPKIRQRHTIKVGVKIIYHNCEIIKYSCLKYCLSSVDVLTTRATALQSEGCVVFSQKWLRTNIN